jgi:hypothetical protein
MSVKLSLPRVFENRVLRGIYGSIREEITRDWRNCTMRSFIICTLTSRRMRWVGYVGRMEESMPTKFWLKNSKGRELQELGVGGRLTSEFLFEKQDEKLWTGFIWFRTGTSEHGNEPSASTKCGRIS